MEDRAEKQVVGGGMAGARTCPRCVHAGVVLGNLECLIERPAPVVLEELLSKRSQLVATWPHVVDNPTPVAQKVFDRDGETVVDSTRNTQSPHGIRRKNVSQGCVEGKGATVYLSQHHRHGEQLRHSRQRERECCVPRIKESVPL